MAKPLRHAVSGTGPLLTAPGAYDCIGARLIELAGFGAVYVTGAGVSAARGYPDYGLITETEMVQSAGAIAQSVFLPVIADADTGYGNELNVTRTVRDYARAGISALHIEDQEFPKRCGHLAGKSVIGATEYLSKIEAAVAARGDDGPAIIARTDARATAGLDEAISRVNAALAAGADMAFVEAPQSLEEVVAIPARINGPCLLNMVPNGRTPLPDLADIARMGYRLAILPGLMLVAALESGEAVLRALKTEGRHPETSEDVVSVFRRFGAGDWDRLRQDFDAGAVGGTDDRETEAAS